jgi:hypothetical protein
MEVEMVALSMLWLPILVAAVLVFIASSILWMALPFWHSKDYGRIPNEKPILDSLAGVTSGQYLVPSVDWGKMTPEARDEAQKQPSAIMLVRNPLAFSFPKTLGLYFLYIVIVSVFVAYVTGRTKAVGADYLEVFRIAGTVAFLCYGLRGIPDSIWYGKPWKVTIKEMIDGLLFGLLTGGAFGWLWPR